MSTHVYTVRAADVGRLFLRIEGRLVMSVRFMGPVQEQDIGKRIYRERNRANDDDSYNIESNEQVARRLEKEGAA